MSSEMNPSYDVFVSYNRRDQDFAEELEQRLAGHMVFRDKSAIQVGDPWFSNVIDAIYSCRLVIVLLSPEYTASSICKAELFHALSRDPEGRARIVLPIMLRTVTLPAALRLIHYYDATAGQNREEALTKILLAANESLGRAQPPTPPVVAAEDQDRLALALELRPDAASLVKVLRMARRALSNLETRAAGYTSATLPATLEIELEDKQTQVSELEDRLRKIIR